MESWSTYILDGVEQVPIFGIPGTIVVYGKQAQAILTNKHCEVLIAAAEMGQGRVVVFAHGTYVDSNVFTNQNSELTHLNHNILNWLTKGTYTEDTQILPVEKYKEASSGKKPVLVWETSAWISVEDQKRLTKFVKDGGSMVMGRCPWGYLQTHPNQTLYTMPMASLLRKIGVAFTTRYYSNDDVVHVSENRSEDSHFVEAIRRSRDLETFRRCSETIFSSLSWIPDEVFQEEIDIIRETVECHRDTVHCCPSPSEPTQCPESKALVSLMSRLLFLDGGVDGKCCKIPSVEIFPGDFPSDPPLQCFKLKITGDSGPGCFIPTGCYLPADHSLTIKILNETPVKDQDPWTVVVGSHTDQLFETSAPWRRWPVVQVKKRLTEKETSIRSPCGGLVYFITPKDDAEPLQVSIENVIEAPLFDVKEPEAVKSWKDRRSAPGLWADLIGEHMVITVPAASVRTLDDPESVVRLWDEVVCGHYELCGLGREGRHREWVVTDEQPRAGYMHAGYPIVTELDMANPNCETSADVGLLCVEGLRRKGSWGMFHELGHNVQDSLWTFSGTDEVTCNIFSLYAMEMITNQKPWIHPWLKQQIPAMQQHFDSGATFKNWSSNAYIAIAIYAQLARDFGWEAYKRVFRFYREMKSSEKPTSTAAKIDCWISTFSLKVGKNLCPVFDFWGFPISERVKETVAHLPAFLFKDETTEMAPDRYADIQIKYGLCEPLQASA